MPSSLKFVELVLWNVVSKINRKRFYKNLRFYFCRLLFIKIYSCRQDGYLVDY